MRFSTPLLAGTLVRRYKRFLADVQLADGQVVTAHCPNSGSMRGCAEPGWAVRLSRSDNPARRLAYTWELVHNGQCWIGINTQWPNRLAEEAILAGLIPELRGYPELTREVPYGSQNSRIDLLLANNAGQRCYVEVKNVTLVGADGLNCFPDAVTTRGRKHLQELQEVVRQGQRGVMLYVVQRADGAGFRPAWEIDPAYADALAQALQSGVEQLVWQAAVSPEGLHLERPLTASGEGGRR